MSLRAFRSSPLITTLYSWLHGSRVRMAGRGHRVERHNAILRQTGIEISGSNCRVVIGRGARLWGCSITVAGDGAELVIGPDCQLRHARISVEDQGSRLVIGAKTSMTGPTLISQEGRLLQIGEDCMVAQRAELRNSDGHAIYDAADARINPPQDVIIGNHVWIGLGAGIFKGARIGDGAIIGAGSHVRGEIRPGCIAYGIPAVAHRQGVRWTRERLTHQPDRPRAD